MSRLLVRLDCERIAEDEVTMHIFLREEDAPEWRLAGTLQLGVGEYQLLGALITLGARQTHGNARVIETSCKGLNDPRWESGT